MRAYTLAETYTRAVNAESSLSNVISMLNVLEQNGHLTPYVLKLLADDLARARDVLEARRQRYKELLGHD